MATIVLAKKPASAAGPFPVTLYTRSTALIDNNKDPLLAYALWIESLTTKGTKTHIYHPPSKGASFPTRHLPGYVSALDVLRPSVRGGGRRPR